MKSFFVSSFILMVFFFLLFLFSNTTTSKNTVALDPNNQVENLMATQKQAEAIQKSNIALPVKKLSRVPHNSFRSYVFEALKSLPTENEARASGEENSHDTPSNVMKAGAIIGYVADKMKSDPRNIEAGLNFFKDCAEGSNTVSSIRAVCLRNLVDFSSRYRNNVRVSLADYPENIQRIARHIPRLR